MISEGEVDRSADDVLDRIFRLALSSDEPAERRVALIRAAAAEGFSLDSVYHGTTLLHVAVGRGDLPLCQFLIDSDVSFQKDEFGRTPIMLAVEMESGTEIAELLLSSGYAEQITSQSETTMPSVNIPSTITALMRAAERVGTSLALADLGSLSGDEDDPVSALANWVKKSGLRAKPVRATWRRMIEVGQEVALGTASAVIFFSDDSAGLLIAGDAHRNVIRVVDPVASDDLAMEIDELRMAVARPKRLIVLRPRSAGTNRLDLNRLLRRVKLRR